MRNGSPVGTKPDLPVTALPAARGEREVQPVLAGISPGSSQKLPVVHESIPAPICAIIKGRVTCRLPLACPTRSL